jgi:hypothetical protein
MSSSANAKPIERGGDAAAIARSVRDLAAIVDHAVQAGNAAQVPDDVMQEAIAALINLYAAKFDAGPPVLPLRDTHGVSATAVLVAVSGLLRAANLEIFELGMWQSWSGRR